MATKAFTIQIDESLLLGITAARLMFNKSLPQTVQAPDPAFVAPVDAPDAEAPLVDVPNPALIATDEEYVQKRLGESAPASWYDSTQSAFRFPTGEWLQRWTPAEKKKLREIGAGLVPGIDEATAAQVQGFLDRLDIEPIVNLTDADVASGVPMVCSLLEAVGTIAAGQGAERAAAINALSV